jgi:hypothetical protein
MTRPTLAESLGHADAGDARVIAPTSPESLGPSRSVYFGEVTGDYQFADPSPVPGFLHYRHVTWWGSLDRDTDLPADRLAAIDRPPTFYKVPDPAWWLEQAHLARDLTARVRAPARSKPPATGPGGSPKNLTVTASQVCTSCGLRKPSAIIESGICADCR